MATKNIILPIPLKSIDSSTFTGSYQIVNTGGLAKPCSILTIINNSTKDVTVSYDGITDHDFVPTLNTRQIPAQAAHQPNSQTSLFAQGTVVYVKGTAGTGLVYLSGYYTPQN